MLFSFFIFLKSNGTIDNFEVPCSNPFLWVNVSTCFNLVHGSVGFVCSPFPFAIFRFLSLSPIFKWWNAHTMGNIFLSVSYFLYCMCFEKPTRMLNINQQLWIAWWSASPKVDLRELQRLDLMRSWDLDISEILASKKQWAVRQQYEWRGENTIF